MELWQWISLGMWTITNLVIVIGAYYKLLAMVKDLDIKHENLKDSFYLHERQNEKANANLEKKFDYVLEGIDYIKKHLIENK